MVKEVRRGIKGENGEGERIKERQSKKERSEEREKQKRI